MGCLLINELKRRGVQAGYKYGHFISSTIVAKFVTQVAYFRAEAKKIEAQEIVGKVREIENLDAVCVANMFKQYLR